MRYICSTCGYVYDEECGIASAGIPPGTRWQQLPSYFACPQCRISKAEFFPMQSIVYRAATANENETIVRPLPNQGQERACTNKNTKEARAVAIETAHSSANEHELSFGQLSALCSGLSNSCARQYLFREAQQFTILAQYYQAQTEAPRDASVAKLLGLMEEDLSGLYVIANTAAEAANDRGAKRILKWGEGVTRDSLSTLSRYQAQGEPLLQNTSVYICEICGHITISDTMPRGCPVCRVSNLKIRKVD